MRPPGTNIICEKILQLAAEARSISDFGLYSGKSGAVLGLHASKSFLNANELIIVESEIKRLLDDISDNVEPGDQSFDNGIFGIAWAVSILYEKNYIVENEVAVMNSFDDELFKLAVSNRTATVNLQTDGMGRILYYLQRVNENLRSKAKYRYLLNYEVLMILIDDFTTKNTALIKVLETDSQQSNNLILEFGGLYTNIFSLLTIMVKKKIYLEVAYAQQIKFICIFANYLKFLINNPEIIYENKINFWNTIPVLNCLLSVRGESQMINQQLMKAWPFFDQLAKSYPGCQNSKELILRIFFKKLTGNLNIDIEIENNISEQEWYYNTLGFDGLSGNLYVLSLLKKGAFGFMDYNFMPLLAR